MLNRIVTWSLNNRLMVIVLSLFVIGSGIHALARLPIDAFPDTTPVQVQINTAVANLSPLEVEQQVTFPVEQVIGGLPGLMDVRSISKFGLSQVTAIFEDGTDIYLARQLVMERLQTVELPEGIPRPEMGPVATGLGEIYHYIVTGEGKSLMELTTIHDWEIKPRLRSVRGVAEVNTWGGERKQFQVLVDPSRLLKYGLTLDHVVEALGKSNSSVGGGNIVQAGELHLVHGTSLTTNVREIGNAVISAHDGVPIRIRDVGDVREGHEIRQGAATANGEGEAVLGLAFMLMGENSFEIMKRLKARMAEIQKSLPPGVTITPVYERTDLVNQVIDTVKKNLFEGAILVVAVLFIFLGHFRAGLIVALAIPLSMLVAFNTMLRCGIAGSLMSLGAIDFGILVDSSVVMVENSVRHLGEGRGDRPIVDTIREASVEVLRPSMYGQFCITVVYLPILALEGIEGKLFRPMALTVLFALMGSLILSLTLMPVLASLVLRRRAQPRHSFIVRAAQWVYRPMVHLAIRARVGVVVLAVALLGWGGWLASQVGSEFIPRLSEMAIVINTVRLSGVSLEESVRYGTQIEKVIRDKHPDEVRDVWVRTGTAEVATDPMGIELSDVFITLKPREEWTRARTQDELVALINEELEDLPGMRLIFTQPIEMRVNEMIAGIRTDVGVKIFGDDLEELKAKATEVEAMLKATPGSADVYREQITGQPVIKIQVDQEAIARHGVPAQHVMEMVEAIGGTKVGEIREGQRRFDLVVRLAERYRRDPTAVSRILIPTAGGERIPLSRLANIRQVEGPSTITREWQKRRIVVQCNVRGRDVGSFVKDVQRRIDGELSLPGGYHVAYGGQFEHLERARERLMIVVPAALVLILFFLYMGTHSVRDALLIFLGAPFAALGGIVALWLRDMPFTISAGVGFVAVCGISMLNGLVIVSLIRQMLEKGIPLRQAVEESAVLRLRPILMTGITDAVGFIPMMLNTGVGAEVQRPLATVVVGGVISDNLLTLLVLPALYVLFAKASGGDRSRNEHQTPTEHA